MDFYVLRMYIFSIGYNNNIIIINVSTYTNATITLHTHDNNNNNYNNTYVRCTTYTILDCCPGDQV